MISILENQFKKYLSVEEYKNYLEVSNDDGETSPQFKEAYFDALMKLVEIRSKSNGIPANGLLLSHNNGYSIIATQEEIDKINILEYGTLINRYKEEIVSEILKKRDSKYGISISEVVNIVIMYVSKEKRKEKDKEDLKNEEITKNGINPFIEIEER